LSLIFAVLSASSARAAPVLEEFGPLPTAAAEPQDIVQGPDGNMWFTERGANKIGRISGTSPGTIDEFAVATGGLQPDIIVVGPDGALWYTELGSNSVGRMPPGNPAGVVRFTGLGIIQARGIAVGPDGNLWIADAGGAQVIRISPAGTAVGSPIALPMGFNARGITLGPDGNMWVGNFSSPGSVARITTGATPAVDPVGGFPVPAGTPIDVIGGSDGNVWYAGQGTTIGKIAPDGTATAFTSKGVDPFGVTLGPDGAVWFAEFQANAVGRVGTDGTTSEVTGMTAGAGPRYVASGPGNTIWFTEETGNRVGRVTGIDVGGGGGGGGGGGADTTDPVVSTLRLSAKRFRIGKKLPSAAAVGTGIRIRYTLSEAATVTLSFERVTRGRKVGKRCVKAKRSNRRRKACKRYAAVKPALSFANQAAGQRSIRFEGRLNRRKTLKPGVYRLTLRARDLAGNRSAPLRAKITVLPRKRKRG
jgi:virginiamycin B lyase